MSRSHGEPRASTIFHSFDDEKNRIDQGEGEFATHIHTHEKRALVSQMTRETDGRTDGHSVYFGLDTPFIVPFLGLLDILYTYLGSMFLVTFLLKYPEHIPYFIVY